MKLFHDWGAAFEIIKGLGLHPLKLLNAFLYGRFTPQYLRVLDWVVPHLPPSLKEHLAERYHGKVLKLEDARKLVSLRHDLELRNLEKVIPYRYARDLVLKNPDHIVVYDCPCRAVQPNPCRPTEVCLIVGEPFAAAVLAVQPGRGRRISSEEALSILTEEEARGHIHTAYFKDIMLDRFYAICNCCPCCCLPMRAFKKHGVRSLAPSGYVAEVSAECTGCGTCAQCCPFEAIQAEEKARVLYEKCLGCGICESKCPSGAMSLKRDPKKGEPLDVILLSPPGRS